MAPFVIMMLIVFGLPVALGLVAYSRTRAGVRLRQALGVPESLVQGGGRSSFKRWWSADRDRLASAQEMARRHHMQVIGDSIEERERLRDFYYFTGRSMGTLEALIVGERESMREALFSAHQRSFVSTLAYFKSPNLKLPVFRVGARDFSLRDRTKPEIVFADVPEFSAAYEVHGDDEAEIRTLLNQRVRSALKAFPGLWIEGRRSELLCVASIDCTLLAEREEFFADARRIYSIVAVQS